MRGFSTVGTSPSDIWRYPTRTLTERFVVIERARGYSSGFSRIYDESRFVNAVLYLLGSGRGYIAVIPEDDIAYNKTWTVITTPSSGTAPACVTDHDDTTYCEWTLAGYATVGCLQLDLGSPMYGAVRALWYSYLNNFHLRIDVSNDGTTWTRIYSATQNVYVAEAFAYAAGYRYIRFSLYNASSSTQNSRLYTCEFYPDTTLPTTKSFSNATKRIMVFVYGSYYQLLEVITL
jgi:hypothetical protein